ncbi:hypothetical protein MF672_038735 [Actinomadura sp. ATCC 31491]|uniref:Fibronectin type-III domain-containing protein n=1 Tax=Actinomadura luzonensis TaxID=2805427 RepID=A0ABT0G6H6_9ACTN|nr:fibronectin type III domain-containing protein [Actinomadura luzonensis]MCK2219691.1 hypothetical protein [Actinomadura luzonensis]
MPVNEKLMDLGSWKLTLVEETPRTVLDQLAYFGHVAFIPGRLDPAQYGDQLLTMARYVGVLTGRDVDHIRKTVDGQSMALWLGDADGKGDVIEAPGVSINATFPNAIRQVLGAGTAVVEGTLYSVPGTYKGRHVWQSKRKAISYICDTMGAEWRVTGDGRLDAGLAEDLYDEVPDTVIVRRRPNRHTDGDDLTLHGLRGDMGVAQDVDDWTDRLVLLAEGQGDAVVTGVATNAVNPYKDLRGQPVKRTRIMSESQTTPTNAQGRAEYQLSRFVNPRAAMRMTTDDYDVIGAFAAVGDWAWVYDPDTGLVDTGNEIVFRGERINPVRLRMVGASWPIRKGMTVAYRDKNGTWLDLTSYVDWEGGETTVDVGDLLKSLSEAGVEPVGPRPVPDSTIPGTVIWDLPFESGVYIGPTGETRAKMLVKWELPLNEDGSTILDGDHYEIAYGVSPATDWATAYAPWGTLQAMINDLSPGVEYDVRIRAVDSSNNQGAWSTVETALANPDTIPPSTPAPPTVAGNRLSIQITHTLGKASGGTFNLEADLDHLEVHSGDTNSYTPDDTTLKGKVPCGAGMILAEIPAVGTVPCEEVTTRYVRVIAVDAAGNRSAPSATATVTALLVDDAHISDLTVTKVTAGTISANWLIGASIRTASSGQRVELNATGLHGYNSGGTELVSLLNTGSFTLRSASSGARVDLSSTSGVQIYNSGGTRTVHLDTDGSFELLSATSGARIQLDGTGFRTYNSSSQATVDISASTGAVTLVGQLATGFSGKRMIFNPSGATLPEIRFTPTSGSQFGRIVATVDTNADYIGMTMESSVWTSQQATVQCWPNSIRLWHYPNVSGFANGMVAQSDGVQVHYNPGSGARTITLNSSGVDISTGGGSFTVNGSTKTFVIDHPLDRDRWLVHATTESPHNGVEYWGTVVLDDLGVADVALPDYFEVLTAHDGRAVLLTGLHDSLYAPTATYPEQGRFEVHGVPGQRVSWLVKAIRKDVPPLLVEPRRDEVTVRGDGPYRYYTIKEPARG